MTTSRPSSPASTWPDEHTVSVVSGAIGPFPNFRNADDLVVGTDVGGYVIESKLAEGGCGAVYIACASDTESRVAIKVLHRSLLESKEMVGRFMFEALAVNRIRHPHIVDIFEFGHLPDGRPFHVMELIEGTGLNALVRLQGPLLVQELIDVLRPIASALQVAHGHGIVHRDLTPSNVVVSRNPSGITAKLLDFGIAKILDAGRAGHGLTAIGSKLGTPVAMSPEQIRGIDVDHRADVYAFGVLIFFGLVGRYPFEGISGDEIEAQHLAAPIPSLAGDMGFSAELNAVVRRCLSKTPDARYDSIGDAFSAFELAGKPRTASSELIHVDAVAIYVAIRNVTGAEIEDEDAISDAANVIDQAQAELDSAGFSFPYQGSTALVAVRKLSDSDADSRAERAFASELARELAMKLASREFAFDGNRVVVSAHRDDAMGRVTTNGFEILGGAVVRFQAWARHSVQVPAAHITPALEGDR
jgi:eukaryotic-like serine/threonine-protein kinase